MLHLVNRRSIEVPPLDISTSKLLFLKAVSALAARYQRKVRKVTKAAFQQWWDRDPYAHSLPLYLLAAAVHAVHDPNEALSYSGQQVISALVLRERGRLQRVSIAVGLQEQTAPRLAAMAMARGALHVSDIRRLETPSLELGFPATGNVIDVLSRLPWWQGEVWPAPTPDILGAALSYTVFRERPDLAPEWLWAAIRGIEPATAFGRLSRILHDVGTVYGEEQKYFVDWLVEMLGNDHSRAAALDSSDQTALRPPLSRVAERQLHLLLKSTWDPRLRPRLLSGLSAAQRANGDIEAALSSAREAVRTVRDLHSAEPDAFDVKLALTLDHEANLLREVGDLPSALKIIEEAYEIVRRLIAANPVLTFDPSSVLMTFSSALSEIGERERALELMRFAVDIRRSLAEQYGGSKEDELARVLIGLSTRLSEVGAHTEALDPVKEAVGILRRFAAARPSFFEMELADSLNTLANRLADVGLHKEGLSAIQEAIDMHRRLARAQPSAFEPNLARSLSHQCAILGRLGARVQAVEAIQEAIAILRRLARRGPGAFDVGLATALNNLSNELQNMGDRAGALKAIREAVDLQRKTAEGNAFEPVLPGYLLNLAQLLSHTGDHSGAMRAIEESVARFRDLVEAQPAAFAADLALSLDTLSFVLRAERDYDASLRAVEEETVILERLVESEPAAFEAALARSLMNLSVARVCVKDGSGALNAGRTSVAIFRRLTKLNQRAFSRELALSLRSLALAYLATENVNDAIDAVTEAIEMMAHLPYVQSDLDLAAQLRLAIIRLREGR